VSLRALGDGLYAYEGGLHPADGSTLHQGVLEGSNVSLNDEMIRLITLSRHIESVQRAMIAYDQMLNVGINELGNRR
jgi:flagellar basal body rod protein FlgG